MREITIAIPKRSLRFNAWIRIDIGTIKGTNAIIKIRRESRVLYNSRMYLYSRIRLFYYMLE
jgi:hypothetical protein